MAPLVLYSFYPSRSTKVKWLMEELAIPYEEVPIDGPQNFKSDEVKAVHPLGLLPALKLEDGSVMLESNAIMEYLVDQYDTEGKMAPAKDSPHRAKYFQWLWYGEATLGAPMDTMFHHTMLLDEDKRIPAVVGPAKEKFAERLAFVDEELKGKQFLAGDFSLADISVAYMVLLAQMLGVYTAEAFPNLAAFKERLKLRPACKKILFPNEE